jgi:pyruvate/2-oxoglutarate dehydrogenase complex dihydrolipoamide acyltransferase (E2) component
MGITIPFELCVPELGMGDRPIKVSLWLVRRGSPVVEGDSVVELQAGETTIDLPSPVSGTLVRRLVGEDELVQVGQPLAIIEADADEP